MLLTGLDISHAYGQRPALTGVSLALRRGEIVSLLGPNGSGKTTLLKILLGLIRPATGEVRLEGVLISELAPRQVARRLAYVPQAHRSTFGYSVLDVVLMGRLPHQGLLGRPTRQDREAAWEALEKLRLSSLHARPYTQVSGGERQLTLIARALAQGAETFILDEPSTALDFGHQVRFQERILELAREGYTFLQSTHFPDQAFWTAGRVILLARGKIVADGPAGETLTAGRFRDLFGAAVRVESVNGLRVCLPEAFLRNRGPAGPFAPRVRELRV